MIIKPHKFPPIEFTKKFNFDENMIGIIIDINSTRKAVNSIHVLPHWAELLEERITGELMVKSIYGTLAIEGNPSTEKEVEETLKGKIDLKKIKELKEQERYNMKRACEFIRRIGKKPKDKTRIIITGELVKELHRLITDKTFENGNQPGQYRNFPVEIGRERYGGIYKPPKILDDIKMLMTGYVEWLNSEEMMKINPIFRAILAHYYMALIHPFGNGNGRTARAVESIILHNFGFRYGAAFALWRNYYENYEEYFTLLNKTRKENNGDQTALILFVLKLMQKTVNSLHHSIIKMIDNLLFKDYIEFLTKKERLSPRQYAIVHFILELGKPISNKELFEHPTINELYKGLDSKTRLTQLDMQHIISEVKLFKKIEKDGREILIPNYNFITKSPE